jgi:hypothetical protein
MKNKDRIEDLESRKQELQKEINCLEEIEWKKNESPLYDKAVGKCYGVNCLKGKKDEQRYLIYYKHLARTDDRDFDCITIEIHLQDGKPYREQLYRETKFYHHASMIGDTYPEISREEFMKVYEQVKRRILI